MSYTADSWQARLCDEHAEIFGRLDKLRAFIYTESGSGTAEFMALPTDDRDDLLEQLMHMEAYENVLARRVGRLVDA